MKKRIWELDALRGLCVVGMVVVHLLFDLIYLYSVLTLGPVGDGLFMFLTQWGGVLFILISGICVTLGSRPVRRGLVVFASGMLCTGVTCAMYFLNLQDKSIIIYFGILHCLGACMLLWPAFKGLPVWALGLAGVVLIAIGFWMESVPDRPHLRRCACVSDGAGRKSHRPRHGRLFPLAAPFGLFPAGRGAGKNPL